MAKRDEEESAKRKRATRTFPASTFEEPLEFAKQMLEVGSGQPVRRLTFFNHYAMLVVSNMVLIAGILLAFLGTTWVAACLLIYPLGGMSVVIVVVTWAMVTVSVTLFARLLSVLF